jgi:1,4-alpha-glucan branching enzyme
MYLVDKFHQNGIGVILDWVPAHFPKDEHGLFEFDGSPCYENQGWDRQENKTWGTRLFDLGRNEVQSFLISNANFLLEKFHVDGLRVDAVASMLYLDYDKKEGEWIPNEYGSNFNIQAIEFFKKLNTAIFERHSNVLMIAEESTSFSMVTKPVSVGGLGFNYKWNMGWMNDTLTYVACDPYFRSGCHDKMTFSMFYAFSENYILPISHDEVVHGKKSLLDKAHGDIPDKFATTRAYMAYMFAHPGKKLSFMGNEYGQFKEWAYKEGLEFFMLKYELHRKLYNFNVKLNHLYKNSSALYEIEDSWDGFKWISADEKDNNILSFKRYDKKGNQLVAIFNFSGNDFKHYRLGVDKGKYQIILNTDSKRFGGSGLINKKTYKTVKRRAHGMDNSITIKVPRLSALYFIKTDDNV